MLWAEICKTYPDQWLIIEALQAHTSPDHLRILDRLAVMETMPDGQAAFQCYRDLHQQFSQRESYFVHTSREVLKIHEQQRFGIWSSHASLAEK